MFQWLKKIFASARPVKQDAISKAYDEGGDARCYGSACTAGKTCNYARGTLEYVAWHRGFADAADSLDAAAW